MEPRKLTPKFTVYSGPNQDSESSSPKAGEGSKPTSGSHLLPVAVRDLVPLLVDAFETDRTWLKDFGREHIHVSADLYEILLAYQQFRRYDAA